MDILYVFVSFKFRYFLDLDFFVFALTTYSAKTVPVWRREGVG